LAGALEAGASPLRVHPDNVASPRFGLGRQLRRRRRRERPIVASTA